jgi:hypothetical protein
MRHDRMMEVNVRAWQIAGCCGVAALALASLSTPAYAAEAAGGAASSRFTLKSRQQLEARSPLTNACYITPDGLALIANGGFSPDNGRTWTPLKPTPDFDSGLPHGYRREWHPPFYDAVTGRVLRIINSMDTPGLDPKIEEPPDALKTYYLRYRVSTDGGKTYLFDEPIVQKGPYSAAEPFAGVKVGRNAIFMGDAGSLPLRTRQGKILVPAQVCLADEKGALWSPGGGFTYTDVLILIGTWKDDGRMEWETSERVQADPARSTRGMIEPTLAEMPDGRLLLVMRGSNGGTKDREFKIPGYRWYAVSADGGYHWTKPEPWCYEDGTQFFSPSSMSQLLHHSSGRTFWIGNISPTNPQGNSPRWPLFIGEVDQKTLRLIKDSLLTIDTLTPEDKAGVELCVHSAVFEDRETGEVVVPMLRYTGGYKSNVPLLYRIAVR